MSAGIAASNQEAARQAAEALNGGRAAEVFGRMVAALGGPVGFIDDYRRFLPRANTELPVKAERDGYVTAIATRDVGVAVVALGGGRTKPDDEIDHAVGLTRLLPVGAEDRSESFGPGGTANRSSHESPYNGERRVSYRKTQG